MKNTAVDVKNDTASVTITPTKRGFTITRKPCVVCGEPPFGSEYCCGHSQSDTD